MAKYTNCSFSYFRDNADDFIAANRFSDLLVKVNLDESECVSVSKASSAMDARTQSLAAQPFDYPDGTKFLVVCVCVLHNAVACHRQHKVYV